MRSDHLMRPPDRSGTNEAQAIPPDQPDAIHQGLDQHPPAGRPRKPPLILIPEAKRRGPAPRGQNFNYANQLQRLHPSFVLQHVATMTTTRHHTAARRRALMRDGTALRFPPAALSGPTADGPGPGAAVQALCPPPARGGNPERVPPCQTYRFGPLPDLPPASFGMTRRCKSARALRLLRYSFPDRPPASPVVRCLICDLPAESATARQEVQPAAFAVHYRNLSTGRAARHREPITTTRQTAKAERAGCCCSAKLRWQSASQPAGCLPPPP